METRIYLYPGMGRGERHYLDRAGTLADLAQSGLALEEGMTVTFFDYDASDKSDSDKLLFEGVVHYDATVQKWYALLDWSSFRHESDL
jgi:hypothetical protein